MYDTAANGVDGTIGESAMAERVFPDSGAWFMLRLLTPPNSLSNVLSIRGTLAGEPPPGAKQEAMVGELTGESDFRMRVDRRRLDQ